MPIDVKSAVEHEEDLCSRESVYVCVSVCVCDRENKEVKSMSSGARLTPALVNDVGLAPR